MTKQDIENRIAALNELATSSANTWVVSGVALHGKFAGDTFYLSADGTAFIDGGHVGNGGLFEFNQEAAAEVAASRWKRSRVLRDLEVVPKAGLFESAASALEEFLTEFGAEL